MSKTYEKQIKEHLGNGSLLGLLSSETYKITEVFHGTVGELCEKIAEQETQP